jgi:hypothetical protein
MVLDQGHIWFRTIRQIQRALRSIASGQLNILRQSRHPLYRYAVNLMKTPINGIAPIAIRFSYRGCYHQLADWCRLR